MKRKRVVVQVECKRDEVEIFTRILFRTPARSTHAFPFDFLMYKHSFIFSFHARWQPRFELIEQLLTLTHSIVICYKYNISRRAWKRVRNRHFTYMLMSVLIKQALSANEEELCCDILIINASHFGTKIKSLFLILFVFDQRKISHGHRMWWWQEGKIVWSRNTTFEEKKFSDFVELAFGNGWMSDVDVAAAVFLGERLMNM